MTQPAYTDADVELVADAIVDARLQGHRDWTDQIARAVLGALATAGRLAPIHAAGRCGERIPLSFPPVRCVLPAGHAGWHREGVIEWGQMTEEPA